MRPPWQMLKSRQKNSADDGCSGYRPGWIPDVDLLCIGRIYGLAGYNWKLTHIKVHIMHFVYPNMYRLIKLYHLNISMIYSDIFYVLHTMSKVLIRMIRNKACSYLMF